MKIANRKSKKPYEVCDLSFAKTRTNSHRHRQLADAKLYGVQGPFAGVHTEKKY